MSTPTPTHDNTVLLVTYNHWLKKAYPLKMSSLDKLGLRVEFRTMTTGDTIIDPTVMLTIVDKKKGEPLYSWNGQNFAGGVDKVPDMAKSFWEGMPAMLAMLRARHIYMKLKRGKDLRREDDEEGMHPVPLKTPGTWAKGISIEHKFKNMDDLVHDRDLNDLKDRYQEATRPLLNRMVGTRVLVQFTGATPLVATEGNLLVTPANLAVDNRASQKLSGLKITVGFDDHGLSFTVLDDWMEASYGWGQAGMSGQMSWEELTEVFGAKQGRFVAELSLNGGDLADAFRESMKTVADIQSLPLPANLDLT